MRGLCWLSVDAGTLQGCVFHSLAILLKCQDVKGEGAPIRSVDRACAYGGACWLPFLRPPKERSSGILKGSSNVLMLRCTLFRNAEQNHVQKLLGALQHGMEILGMGLILLKKQPEQGVGLFR